MLEWFQSSSAAPHAAGGAVALEEVRGGEDDIARVVDVHDAVMVTVDAIPAGVLEGGMDARASTRRRRSCSPASSKPQAPEMQVGTPPSVSGVDLILV